MFRLIPLCVKYSMRFGWHKLVEPTTSIRDWLGEIVLLEKVRKLLIQSLDKGRVAILLVAFLCFSYSISCANLLVALYTVYPLCIGCMKKFMWKNIHKLLFFPPFDRFYLLYIVIIRLVLCDWIEQKKTLDSLLSCPCCISIILFLYNRITSLALIWALLIISCL